MRPRDPRSPLVVCAVAALCTACGGDAGTGPASMLPEPPPDLGAADPLVAALVERSIAAIDEAPQSGERWRRLGMVYQANRMDAPATGAYREAVALDPSDVRAWYGLGTCEANLGRATEALAAYDRVAPLADYPPLDWRRGFLLLETGRLAEARAAFDRTVERNGTDPAGHVGLARIDLLEGHGEAAISRLEWLIESPIGQSNREYLHHLLGIAYRQAGRLAEAEAALTEGRNTVAVWRDPWTDELLALRRGFDWTLLEARRAMADGRLDVAVPALEQLRTQRPNDRELLVTLGTAYSATGRTNDANEAFRELGHLHADDYRAHYELSRYHDRGRRFRQALQHAERSLELNDGYAPGWRQKGVVLRHLKRLGDCETAAARASELDPADAGAWRLLGDCRMDGERWAAAAVAFEGAVAAEPADGLAWLRLAEAAARSGDAQRALVALDRVRRSGAAGAERADALADTLGLPSGGTP